VYNWGIALFLINQQTVQGQRGGFRDVNDGRFCSRFIRMTRTCVRWCVAVIYRGASVYQFKMECGGSHRCVLL